MIRILIITQILISQIITATNMQQQIEKIVEGKDLTVGVAISSENGETLVSINNKEMFPMQSIYKLPIAMAYLNSNREGCLSDSVRISKSELLPNTWSPFRESYPNGSTLSISEFIRFVVAESDNNLCDVMIDLAGGIDSISRYVNRIGIDSIVIRNYEREIQSSWDIQFSNSATPDEIIKLLRYLWCDIKSESQSSKLLWKTMQNTTTGSARKLLREDTVIGYKTGFSGKSPNGVTAANNCVGIIKNKDGENIFFAIFITDSHEEEGINYNIISEIVKAISS